MSPPSPDRYAVIGHPVAHSRSPAIQSAFAQATRQVLHYERLEAPLDGFAATVQAFAAAGAKGCNVTVPFKFEALALCPRHTPRAVLAGAANLIRFDADGWLADNTDGIGLMRDLAHNAGMALAGARVLLIGAGGAAAGVLGPLIETRPAEIVIANRSTDKAHALAARHQALAQTQGVSLCVSTLASIPGPAFDGVINASASSLAGTTPSPVADHVLRPGTWVVDLMYGPAARPFLRWAQALGGCPRDGLGMLVEQAAEAFALWRGVRPDTTTLLRTLRQDVDASP